MRHPFDTAAGTIVLGFLLTALLFAAVRVIAA